MPDNAHILYEDNHLLAVIKQPGLLSQADATGDPDLLTLLKEDLKRRYQKQGNVYLGLVHRLDRPVGGVMVLARTSKAASRLSEQIRQGKMEKDYLAVVRGCVPGTGGVLRGRLLKDRKTNVSRLAGSIAGGDPETGKFSHLQYRVVHISKETGMSLLLIRLGTGRAHQIRLLCAEAGWPVAGDRKYGTEGLTVRERRMGRDPALWAYRLSLAHPVGGRLMCFSAYPPAILPWTQFERYMDSKVLILSEGLIKGEIEPS